MTSIAIALVAVVLMVVGLRLLGRPWGCACGEYRIWAGQPNVVHGSQHPLDGWSLSHVGHGLLFYSLFRLWFPGQPVSTLLAGVVVLEAAWEVFENTDMVIEWFRRRGDKEYFGDAVLGSGGDVLCCVFGALIQTPFI